MAGHHGRGIATATLPSRYHARMHTVFLTNQAMAIHKLFAVALLGMSTSLTTLSGTEMPDQRGGRDSLAAHRGSPVVAVVVDARRLGTVKRWEQDLLTRFPGLHVMTVADVNETRPPSIEQVAAVLARRVPADVAVLIDMERLWAREFALDTAAPNLVLIDATGAPVAQFRGRWSAELAAEVRDRVAALLGAA